MNIAIVILAAGKGKRMGLTDKPKVMAELAGKPLIGHVLEAVLPLQPSYIIPVIGFQKDIVKNYLDTAYPHKTMCVIQEEQLGTGHAVQQSSSLLSNFDGWVLIVTGDTPLITTATLQRLLNEANAIHPIPQAVNLSAFTDTPYGYGRIVRNTSGDFTGIVEEKDANEHQKLIQEINTGVFLVQAKALFSSLKSISNRNAQGEYYLTDIISVLQSRGESVSAIPSLHFDEFRGINTLDELQSAQEIYNSREQQGNSSC